MVALLLYAALCGSASADVFDDNPAAVSLGAGNVQLFARSADGQILHRQLSAGAWSSWAAVPGLQAESGPAAAVFGTTIYLFARGADGAVWQNILPLGGAWSGWESLGGQATSAPGASTRVGNGTVDLFVRGTDNGLYHRALVPGQGWTPWEALGGNLTSAPTALGYSTSGSIDVFVRDTAGGTASMYYVNGAWNGWYGYGGSIRGAVALASPATDVLQAYARGSDDGLWLHRHAPSNTDWTRIDTTALSSSPAGVSDTTGSVWLFARIGDELFTRNVSAAHTATPSYGGWVSTGRVALPAAPTPPAPLPPPVTLTPSLSYTFKAARRSTRLRTLTVKNIPAGATVKVTCSPGCSTKRWTTTPKRSTLSLKKFTRKALRVNAKLTVTVWKPGAIASVKTLKIRRSRSPQLISRCLPPGAKAPQRCAT
ncbi:hypothetical protein C8N24_1856 [Solirubrobacter pauli]|uniref:PLL-like beta propeller domain-containing protein n=1 Tax=Solirubrobacter pauli TaxID=166793 RepID=A0A660LAE2_9ACTN|nr:hypothetical protein C8N24_1856 [Solirubrobacter pauli]